MIRRKCYNLINMLSDICLTTYSTFGKRRGSCLPTLIEVRKEDNGAYGNCQYDVTWKYEANRLKLLCIGADNDLIIRCDFSTNS